VASILDRFDDALVPRGGGGRKACRRDAGSAPMNRSGLPDHSRD